MTLRSFGSRVAQMGVACLFLITPAAFGAQYAVGYVSWDINFPGNAGQFDIANLSGANSLAPGFPVLNGVSLSNLSLTVTYANSTNQTFGSSYFTLGSDGLSFDGNAIPIGGTNPLPIAAVLSGTFVTTSLNVSGVGVVNIAPTFTASVLRTGANPTLLDGDFAVIFADTAWIRRPRTFHLVVHVARPWRICFPSAQAPQA